MSYTLLCRPAARWGIVTLTPVLFHHADPGTPESTWLADERLDHVPVLDLTAVARRYGRVLVVAAAHPILLYAGGRAGGRPAHRGVALDVLVATDGDGRTRSAAAGHGTPWLPTAAPRWSARWLGSVERARPTSASRTANWSTTQTWSSTRCGHVPIPTPWCWPPWIADGHADHDALGRHARRRCRTPAPTSRTTRSGYGTGGHRMPCPWPDVVASESSRVASWRKRVALQESPCRPPHGRPPPLGASTFPCRYDNPPACPPPHRDADRPRRRTAHRLERQPGRRAAARAQRFDRVQRPG